MSSGIKKVWFKEGKSFHCYACNYPYNIDSIIKNGVKYEKWIKLDTFNEVK